MERSQLEGKMYMETFCSSVDHMIPEREYRDMVEREEREQAEYETKTKTAERKRDRRPGLFPPRVGLGSMNPSIPKAVYYDEGRSTSRTIWMLTTDSSWCSRASSTARPYSIP